MEQKRTANASTVLEENLKKALTEMLVLRLLSEREYYIGELGDTLKERSGGALCIVFPYAAIYRMEEYGYIYESGKRIGPDGRRRRGKSVCGPADQSLCRRLKGRAGGFGERRTGEWLMA